jgi:hypothetical protein
MTRIKLAFALALWALITGFTAPAHAVWKQVKGTLTYDDGDKAGVVTGQRPIKYVTVQFFVGGSKIGAAKTTSAGEFSTYLDPALINQSTVTMRIDAESYAAKMYLDLDWENDTLYWTVMFPFVVTNEPWDFSVNVGKEDFSVHFNILDAIQVGRGYANNHRDETEDDAITQVDVQYPDADGSSYSGFWSEITIKGPPAFGYGGNGPHDSGWTDDVALHEYAHHLENHIAYLDNQGASHGACTNRNYSFAWQEGFPAFFARAVYLSQSPPVVTTEQDYEPTPNCSGYLASWWTTAALYDVLDGANEPHDRVDGARLVSGLPLREYIFRIFDRTEPASIYGFHDGFVGRKLYPGSHGELDRLLLHHHALPHAQAEFEVTSVTVPGAVSPGAPFKLWNNLENSGFAYPEDTVRYRAWLLGPSGPTYAADEPIDTFKGKKQLSQNAQLPSNLPPGTYTLTVSLDAGDRYAEVDEANNDYQVPLTVAVCGNGVCSPGETYVQCPADCSKPPVVCGDDLCSPGEKQSCPGDCVDPDYPPICDKKPDLPQCQPDWEP